MTLIDVLVLLVILNILFSLLILVRLGLIKRELVKLRRKRTYKPAAKKRGRPPK